MPRSIRDDIKRDHLLAEARKGERAWKKAGQHAQEVSSANRVFYCRECKGPVVDSDRGRRAHAYKSPKCANAMKGDQT
jgi:hypothetical protein